MIKTNTNLIMELLLVLSEKMVNSNHGINSLFDPKKKNGLKHCFPEILTIDNQDSDKSFVMKKGNYHNPSSFYVF